MITQTYVDVFVAFVVCAQLVILCGLWWLARLHWEHDEVLRQFREELHEKVDDHAKEEITTPEPDVVIANDEITGGDPLEVAPNGTIRVARRDSSNSLRGVVTEPPTRPKRRKKSRGL